MWKINILIDLNWYFKYGLIKFYIFNFIVDVNMDRDGKYYKCVL